MTARERAETFAEDLAHATGVQVGSIAYHATVGAFLEAILSAQRDAIERCAREVEADMPRWRADVARIALVVAAARIRALPDEETP